MMNYVISLAVYVTKYRIIHKQHTIIMQKKMDFVRFCQYRDCNVIVHDTACKYCTQHDMLFSSIRKKYKKWQHHIQVYIDDISLLDNMSIERLLKIQRKCETIAAARRKFQCDFNLDPDWGHEKMIAVLYDMRDLITSILKTRFENESQIDTELSSSTESNDDTEFCGETETIVCAPEIIDNDISSFQREKVLSMRDIKCAYQKALEPLNKFLISPLRSRQRLCHLIKHQDVIWDILNDKQMYGTIDWSCIPDTSDDIFESIYQGKTSYPVFISSEIVIKCLAMLISTAQKISYSFMYTFTFDVTNIIPEYHIKIKPIEIG